MATVESQPHSKSEASAPQAEDTADGHRAIQEQIARKAKKHGFVTSVEYLLPSDKRIDVMLAGHGLRVAVEVSVTNREEYELSNVEKALEAGFSMVWMVTADAAHRDKLEQFIRNKLPGNNWPQVLFGAVDDISQWLERHKAPARSPSSVAGYAVSTTFRPPANEQDQRFRLDQLRRIVSI